MMHEICVESPRGIFTIYNRDFTLSRIVQRSGEQASYYRNKAFWQLMTPSELTEAQAAFQARPLLTYQPAEEDRIVCLPFAGFYESMWSNLVDHEAEQFCEYEAERETDATYHPEDFQPEPLRIDSSEYADLLWRHIDASDAYRDIARDYVDAFSELVSGSIAEVLDGFALGLRYESLSSPRYYNFATDRVFAYIPFSVVQQLFDYSARHHHAALAAVLQDRHTSYSGFISSYSNQLPEWLQKPLQDWDHNELQSLLLACMAQAAAESRYWQSGEGIDWRVFDEGDFASHGHSYFETAVNWPEFEAARDELRAEKLQEAIDSGELEGEAALPYRCPETLDLFA